MASHKNQHFIPRCYLKAWCDPLTPSKQTPYVWQFSKDGKQVKKKSPENIFYEKDIYTILEEDGSRNLVFENNLNRLETQFTLIRDKKLKYRRKLETQEHFLLCHFIAAMFARTKARKNYTLRNWNKVLEMAEKVRETAKDFTPEQREQSQKIADVERGFEENGESISEDEVRQIVAHPMQTMLPAEILELTPLFFEMNMVVIETKDSTGFITSDNPCVWFDPEAYKRPPAFQSPGLMYESTEIRFPVSPNQMIVFTHKLHPLNNSYVPVDNKFVNDTNRVTRFFSQESFVVNSNTKKDVWFL